MSKKNRGYILLIIFVLSIFLYYLPVPIIHMKIFNDINIDYASANIYDTNTRNYHLYKISDGLSIDRLTKFINKIVVHRKIKQNELSYMPNNYGEFSINIRDINDTEKDIYFRLFNHKYIEIDGQVYRILGGIDYNLLNSILQKNTRDDV